MRALAQYNHLYCVSRSASQRGIKSYLTGVYNAYVLVSEISLVNYLSIETISSKAAFRPKLRTDVKSRELIRCESSVDSDTRSHRRADTNGFEVR